MINLIDEIDNLLSQMTLEEKIQCLTMNVPAIERLGIPAFTIGGEMAHGIEARNDQEWNQGEPEVTTCFTQPIGMSASFNRQLIYQVGEVVGTEARALFVKNKKYGLSRFAPTVDLCRDPRWGRNEEGYGEDPYQVGEMASAYIKGIQGEDDFFLRCAATIKHFYANNTEKDREKASSNISDANKREFYWEPFRKAIMEGRAENVMTSYNEINHIPAIVNPEINELLRDQWGLKGHVVCDMGDLTQLVTEHHYCDSMAKALADALLVGVDVFNEPDEVVINAAREAYEKHMITLEDIDTALRHSFATKIRLGVYPSQMNNPYLKITASDVNTKAHQEICLEMAKESIVLLKNENSFLPWLPENHETIAVIGPLADGWHKDWYCGIPNNPVTPLQGIKEKFPNATILFDDGCNCVKIQKMGLFLAVCENGTCEWVADMEKADLFTQTVWDSGLHTFYHEKSGKYLRHEYETGILSVERTEAFSWFVEEGFDLEIEQLHVLVIDDGIERVKKIADRVDKVIAVMGCHPIVSCKEGIDRKDIDFAKQQRRLMQEIFHVNQNVVMVLITNYPYAITWEAEHIPAILTTASGSQSLGTAIAAAIAGEFSPAGRLPQTWYLSAKDLPPMEDYDIIGTGRTYRYFQGKVLYPFGFGLSYTEFLYEEYQVKHVEKGIHVEAIVKNIGNMDSQHVVLFFDEKKLVYFEKVLIKANGRVKIDKIIL